MENLGCNIKFQGINATKALAHVIETKRMHINRYRASIDKAHLSRYKDLKQIKDSREGILNDYSQKVISSISRLQDISSEVVESNIQRNYRDVSSSNLTARYNTSYFSINCSTSPDKNLITSQKGSIFFIGDHKTQKIMAPNEICLTLAIPRLNISEGI